MAKNILELVIKLIKDGGGDKETIAALTSMKKGMGQLAMVAGTVTAAVVAVDKVLDATVGKFVSYASKVSVFSSALSTTSEEGSKLIQVADDFGISADAMQTAMFKAVKNGIDPTVEGLARAADHYNSLTTAEDKANYMQTTFGKGSQELARLLSTGSAAIREQTSNLGSLLLTQQDLNEARALEIAQNNLLDEQEKMQITTGKQLLPVQLSITQNLVAQATAWEDIGDASGRAMDPALAGAIRDYRNEIEQLSNAEGTMVRVGNEFISVIENSSGTMTRLGNNFVTSTASGLEMATNFQDILSVSKELQTVEEKRAALNDKLAEAVKLFGENSKQAKELRGEIGDLAEETQRWTNQFIFGLMQTKLAADGVLSEDDIQKLLVYGEYLGVVSENATESYEEMLLLAGAIELLPDGKTINIDVNLRQHGSIYVPGAGDVVNLQSGKTVQESAYGGRVNANGITVVGDIPGLGWGPHAEVIINGQVLPHAQAQFLKDMGLLDGAPAYATGTLTKTGGTFGKRPTNTASGRIPSSNQSTGSITTTVHSGGGVFGAPASSESAGAVSAVESAAASVAAVDAIAPVVTETVQNFEQSQRLVSRENSAQVRAQTAAVLATSAEQTKLLRRIADTLEAQAEQLAAEIQKQGGSR